METKVFAENRKAHFNYEILEKFQAGLVLLGPEVKSIKLGHMQIAGSYVIFKNSELFLVGSTVSPYQPKNIFADYNPERSRKLLLKKKELMGLVGRVKERGLTLIPLRVYTTPAGNIKLEFALAKGKKKWDKREAMKKRDIQEEMRRTLKASL